MPFPQTPSFSGLGSSTLPTLKANVSQDNRFDRVLEGLLSEGRSTRSRDCSTDSDMTACSHPSGTGGDPESISQYLKGLAELNSTLLQSRANRHGAGHSDLGKSQPLPTRTGSSVPLSIGWTLTHCQQFLNMLQNLQRHVSPRAGHDTWSPARLEDTIDLSATPPSPAPLHQTPPRVSTLDTPILFSILSCYAYILEEYERLFSYILKSVIQPVPQIPATLIGISLDGFKLDGNNTLQMEFLLYISSNMLEKIETILVGSSQGTTAVPNQGLLGYKMMACLESLYDHVDVSTDDGADNREVRAITLIRKIQAALKNLEK
ncbi:uncharacterized protein N7500_001467 [Penicillium coprophilum]|uniref:uncharacterized protein n=1 Tax=Penicillium coprophilum TaxID=36646 RepID=UPI00239B1479|nr:uncharacterized protein N7500_001467 [Penicillium coprophilum]KAJ5173536.1 hypothetical protein N7500_001467 [Penicillium coprophilum]